MYEELSVFMLARVSSRFAVLVLVPVFLIVGGCGGSSHSGSSTTTTATAQSSTATNTSAAASTTSRTTTSKAPATGSSNVRIPARFEIGAGGKLTPPQIAVPAKLPIELTFVSKDGHSHHVVVMATSLRVPAGGEASKVIPGPRRGHYPVKVDGVAAGLLVTGVNPGP